MTAASSNVLGIASARPWVLIAAYDASTGASTEGYVAFQLLRELRKNVRIVLVTRKNNAAALRTDSYFRTECAGVRVVGFDLPEWARRWKRGARLYQAYAWLWQMSWPIAVSRHTRLVRRLAVVHVLNFHNDSFPSLAWYLGRPTVWGPINHNERWPHWRLGRIPRRTRWQMWLAFNVRRIQWRCDPFLRLCTRRASVILAAGPWVNRRLRLRASRSVEYRSQLGVSASEFVMAERPASPANGKNQLVYAGRLDWIKGVDLALEALALLPTTYRLEIIGRGPAKATLQTLADELGLSRRVHFRNSVQRMDLAAIYAGAGAFLFPSAEVAGLGWVEALACGLQVVGFADETELTLSSHALLGVYLAPNMGDRTARVRNYADAITRAMEHRHRRVAIRQRVLDHYAWTRLASVVSRAYHQAWSMQQ